jgi:YesN/AraC family two-component response regulator
VLTGLDAADALALAEVHTGPIHLLVTDVVMPVMGGRELASRVRVLRPEVKLLFMSGYTDDTVVREGISSDEVAFLQKPFTAEALARKVRETLDG